MKVTVLNGSPKGRNSITLQSVRYLMKLFPQDVFTVVDAGQKIKALERDLTPCLEALADCDLILFAYPVYTFLAPYQLHRLVELLKERQVDLSQKWATQLTTSKHFFDVTAHGYVEDNCRDFGCRIIPGLSADMDDLLTARGREDAVRFWDYVHFCFEHSIAGPVCPKPGREPKHCYRPSLPQTEKQPRFDTVLLTDAAESDANLQGMMADFARAYPYPLRVINVADYPFAGGCLGCFHCAGDGKCIYRDGFDSFLRREIQRADAILYAFTLRDHSMGADFKLYDDRQFCNGHRTVAAGTVTGYLISGPYSEEANLQMVLQGRCQVGRQFLAGIATDEGDTAAALLQLAQSTAFALERHMSLPQNFYGVGGMKIFRDLIYTMGGLMREDHRFYRQHKLYDFPQKKVALRLKMKLVGWLMAIPAVKNHSGAKMNQFILKPYDKVLKAACSRGERAE